MVDVLSEGEDLEVVGEAGDGAQAVEMARALLPHVVIMDLHMPGIGGLEAIAVLRSKRPCVQVLVFTVSENECDLFTAMRYGAKGYILKSADREELVQDGLHIAQGGVIISPTLYVLSCPESVHCLTVLEWIRNHAATSLKVSS